MRVTVSGTLVHTIIFVKSFPRKALLVLDIGPIASHEFLPTAVIRSMRYRLR